MHKFIEYISDLLFLHDCVIIPGFGGFICNYKNAFIDETHGTICPPSKDILFNKNLTHNDGLLVSWVATKESISYEKATKQIVLFCEDLKIKLNQKQEIEFGDIGVFYTDRRFNIIFDPGKANFLSEAYQMEAVKIPRTSVQETVHPSQAKSPAVTSSGSPYINTHSGNVVQRLLKYGLGAAAVTGIVVVSQLEIFHFDRKSVFGFITNTTALQPILTLKSSAVSGPTYNNVISPACDYIDYDPVNDLVK